MGLDVSCSDFYNGSKYLVNIQDLGSVSYLVCRRKLMAGESLCEEAEGFHGRNEFGVM
jgi:hypothetical protein